MTTAVYNYQFVPISLSANSAGTFVSIQAYLACDTQQPIASASYTLTTAAGSSAGPPMQLCAGANAITASVIASWDGITVNNASGFTVTINGSPTVNQPQAANPATLCSELAQNGAQIPCKAASVPTASGYVYLYYPASQLNGSIFAEIERTPRAIPERDGPCRIHQ